MPYFKDNWPVTLRQISPKIKKRITYLTIIPFLAKIVWVMILMFDFRKS
jgi:hypothetical protein